MVWFALRSIQVAIYLYCRWIIGKIHKFFFGITMVGGGSLLFFGSLKFDLGLGLKVLDYLDLNRNCTISENINNQFLNLVNQIKKVKIALYNSDKLIRSHSMHRKPFVPPSRALF